MPNQMTGKILYIGKVDNISYNEGTKTFQKRTVVLDSSHYDQFTGEKYENYPSFDFTGKHLDDVNAFKEGDLVTIYFVIQGKSSVKDGQQKFFNSVVGFKIEQFQRQGQQVPPQQIASTTQAPLQQTTAQPQSKFPPQVDANGVPKDDLPF